MPPTARISVPEEQRDGKDLGGRSPEAHRHLDGVGQVLLGDVEAVVGGLPALQDVLMLRGLKEDRRDQMTSLAQMVENSGKIERIKKKKKQGGVADIYWSWLLSELNGYRVNKGAARDLPPGAALVQVQVDHRSIQLD